LKLNFFYFFTTFHCSINLQLQELENVNEVQAKEVEDLNACISSLREENSQIRSKLQEMQSLKHDLEV